jgi:hypothetical protein
LIAASNTHKEDQSAGREEGAMIIKEQEEREVNEWHVS